MEDISVEKINISILQKNLNGETFNKSHTKSPIKPISETLLLKAKVINDEINKVLEDEEMIIDEEDQLDIQHYMYNPETAYVEVPKNSKDSKHSEHSEHSEQTTEEDVEDVEDVDEEDISEREGSFTSYGTIEPAPVVLPLASYETYIVNAKTLHVSFNNVLCNDSPAYRITIYDDCTIRLNIIGTKTNTYSYVINADQVVITKLNTVLMSV